MCLLYLGEGGLQITWALFIKALKCLKTKPIIGFTKEEYNNTWMDNSNLLDVEAGKSFQEIRKKTRTIHIP